MEQHRIIELEGHKVHYRDEGRDNKHTVVFLHGFMQSLDVWSSYVLTYMHHLRVITIDLPGHGMTDCFGETHTMDFMARTVHEVLVSAGVDQCVMIGHSMGGYVALAFAEMYPYTLRGLGLISSHALADSAEHKAYREDVCRQVADNRAKFTVDFVPRLFCPSRRGDLYQEIKDLSDQCLETSAAAITAAQRGMAERPSRIGVLKSLEVPILFIYGKDDCRLPIEIAVTQAMIPHHSEMLLLDKVGHMAFMEERDYVKPRIKNFVDTCYY